MSDGQALHDYSQSRAVLIGTAEYCYLKNVEAAANSLQRMSDLLISDLCGWPSNRVTVRLNEQGPGDLQRDLIIWFQDISDIALFYFVGHGQIDTEDKLCLGLVKSQSAANLRAVTSLPFQAVRRAMRESRARTKIVILDCCFAGLARETAVPLTDQVADRSAGAGAYLIAASGAYETTWFEVTGQQPQTFFTKYFADLIEAGIPNGPPLLQLHTIFTALQRNLARDGHPVPVARNTDWGGELSFTRNTASPPTRTLEPEPGVDRPQGAALDASPESAEPASLTASPQTILESGVSEEGKLIADLRSEASELLRAQRWEAYRRVHRRLQALGSSARPIAILQTTMGTITVELLPDYAPRTVKNFVALAQGTIEWKVPRARQPNRASRRLYDNTLFHKVIHGLLIQGGDPLGTGTGGPGYQFTDEFHPDLTFDHPYMLAMANKGPDTNGSQFFITVAPAPQFSGKHAIFGNILTGQDVVNEISRVRTRYDDRPLEAVMLKQVIIDNLL